MAFKVRGENEIWLNSQQYNITGELRRVGINRFPPKRVEGDYSLVDDPNLSHWIVKDQRGGIGVEDYRGLPDLSRCFFSTLNLNFAGSRTLPPLATAPSLPTLPTITDGGMEAWDDVNTLTNWTKSGTSGLVQGTGADAYAGTYSAHLTNNAGTGAITQTLTGWSNNFRGKQIVITAYCKTSGVISTARMIMDDGIGTTAVSVVNASFTQFTVTRTLNAAATKIDIQFELASGAGTGNLYVDSVAIAALGTLGRWCNYNGNTYFAAGKILYKVSSTDGAIYLEGIFPNNITDLVSTVGTNLAVLQGDSANLWYITSAGVFTQTTDASAMGQYGITWQAHFLIITTAGQMKYIDTLSAAGAFTNKGLISDGSTINSLELYHDTALASQVYCGTSRKLWVHDYTNAVFLEANLEFAEHPNAGKTLRNWDTVLYVPMGLCVHKYFVDGGAASTKRVGLDLDDGVPNEYAGEIVTLINDVDNLYALVDGTQYGTLSYSWVAKYNGSSWQCLWSSASLDDWVSPTGSSDPSTAWSNDSNIYDADTGTYAETTSTVAAAAWSGYLIATIAATSARAVRYWVNEATAGTAGNIEVDVYDGSSWTAVYSGTVTLGAYVELEFQLQLVTQVRIRIQNTHAFTAGKMRIMEVGLKKANVNLTMGGGIVSTTYSRRFWFNCGSSVYYIPLQRTLISPKKVSGYTYATAGTHWTPWFDGGAATHSKLARALKRYCQDMTSNETVVVKYRTNKSATDLYSGWTTLATVTADGKTETNFGTNGVGVSVNTIQFRFDLVRGGTNTLSPDLQGHHLAYRTLLPAKYGYAATIVAQDTHKATALDVSLITAYESETLLEMVYRDTSLYVMIESYKQKTPTGTNHIAEYEVVMIEL